MRRLRKRLKRARERLWNRVRRRHDAPHGSPQRAFLGQQVRKARRFKDKLVRRLKRRRLRWPSDVAFSELLYHSPPHLHIATPERDKLIQICKIAQRRWGLTVSEFPPFDPQMDPVHVSGSWHYRDSSNPWVLRSFANRGDGLAADINGTREVEFYNELRRRYG